MQPTDVSETVQLTHPFLPAGARFQEAVIERIVGDLGVVVANHSVVPAGRFWYVPYWQIRHDDPVAHRITWEIENFDSTTAVIIENTQDRADGAPYGANEDAGITRSILIPPGFRAVAAAQVAVGQGITSTLLRVEYPLAENPPPY